MKVSSPEGLLLEGILSDRPFLIIMQSLSLWFACQFTSVYFPLLILLDRAVVAEYEIQWKNINNFFSRRYRALKKSVKMLCMALL